jgi:hypothetical protein
MIPRRELGTIGATIQPRNLTPQQLAGACANSWHNSSK